MKIAIDARLYGTEFTGLGRYTKNLVDQLAELDKKNRYFVLLRKNYYKRLGLPRNFKKIEADFPIYTFQEQIKLPFLLNNLKPDLTHFPHLNVPVLYGRKFIVTIHDIIMQNQGREASTLPFPVYYFKRFPFKYTSYFAVKRSEKIICPSKAVKEEIVGHYKIARNKIKVTYEGVDTDLMNRKKVKEVKRYFLYVGNAYPHKNLKFLIQAIKELNQVIDNEYELYIRTDKNMFRQRLEKYVKEIKAQNHVKFINRVTDEELSKLYMESTAYVFPSLTEGFGLPGLEAIQNDTLLLASDTKVFREVYGKYAIYFDPRDPTDLINKLKKVIDMKEKERSNKIQISKEIIKKYSWEDMVKQTIKIYNSF